MADGTIASLVLQGIQRFEDIGIAPFQMEDKGFGGTLFPLHHMGRVEINDLYIVPGGFFVQELEQVVL